MAGSYANFLSTTSAANKDVTDYSSMDAHTASKIAGYEASFSEIRNWSTEDYKPVIAAVLAGRPQTEINKLIADIPGTHYNNLWTPEDGAYIAAAIRNVETGNTLLDPSTLQSFVKSARNVGSGIDDLQAQIEDNIYLTWKAAGSGDYSRNFGEWFAGRASHNLNVPYTLNPNYIHEGATTTLSGQAASVNKGGKVTNDYLNTDGTLSAAGQNILAQLGVSSVDAPALQEFKAINPLEGKTLSDRGLKTLETLQNSGLAEMLTPEFVKSFIDGYNYIGVDGWAAKQGLDQFSAEKFNELYKDAAEKQNNVLDAQYRAAVNNFYQALGAQNNILAQELRKAAAQAQASRANAGMASANQLSAALAQTQNTSKDALEVAQKGIELGEKKAENVATALRDAFTDYKDTYLSGVDKMNTANSNRVQGGAAAMGLAGDLANAEAAVYQTTTEAATSTNATNQAAIASKNQLAGDIYTANKGAQASVTNAMITGENDFLNAIANLGGEGTYKKNGHWYTKDGKIIL